MKAWSWLCGLLPVLAIVGLVFGSVAASANNPEMTAAPSMSAMADGMPCCHDKQPAKPICPKDCPMAVVCMAACFAAIPSVAPLSRIAMGEGDLLTIANEYLPSSRASTPPARPPRA